MKKRILSTLLALVMCLSLLPTAALADGGTGGIKAVSYLDKDGQTQTQDSCDPITSSTTTLDDAKWYYAEGSVTIDGTLRVSGSVHLILCDGADLKITGGINGTDGQLTVYGQSDSDSTGKLTVTGVVNTYGNTKEAVHLGSMTVNGGDISVTSEDNTSTSTSSNRGIFLSASSNALTVNGGKLTATGGAVPNGSQSYGIYTSASGVTVNGGALIATGGMVGKAGAWELDSSSYEEPNYLGYSSQSYGINVNTGGITVTGGTVTATGGTVDTSYISSSYGIYAYSSLSCITVSGGTLNAIGGTAKGYNNSGTGSYGIWIANNNPVDVLVVSSGTVNARGGTVAGKDTNNIRATSYGIYAECGSMAVSGGTVNVTAGDTASNDIHTGWDEGLAISGGTVQKLGTTGGAVNVFGGNYITVTGGTISLAEGSRANKLGASSLEALNALIEDGCAYYDEYDYWDYDSDTSHYVKTLMTDEDVIFDNSSRIYYLASAYNDGYICALVNTTAKNVPYLDKNGALQTCSTAEKLVSADEDVTLESGWYVVSDSVTISGMLTVDGDVHLILADGCQLTVNGKNIYIIISTASAGIQLENGSCLTIYGQSKGNRAGKLNVSAPKDDKISFAVYLVPGSNRSALTINGGDITATAGQVYQSSYGVFLHENQTLTVNGGKLTAIGGTSNFISNGICINPNASMLVNGGEIEATGGEAAQSSAGIYLESADTLIVNGGKVTTTGGKVTDSTTTYGSYGIGGNQAKLIYGTLIGKGSSDCAENVNSHAFRNKPTLPAAYQWRTSETGSFNSSDESAYNMSGGNYAELTAAMPANAVPYLDENGSTAHCTFFTTMTSSTSSLSEGWYVVSGNVTLSDTLSFIGEVHLILCDNAVLTAPKGISGAGSLSIYAQSKQDTATTKVGKLVATDPSDRSAYGIYLDTGDLTINGGMIEASAPNAQFGYGISLDRGNLTVNDGKLTAVGGKTVVGEDETTGDRYRGIYVYGNVTINGGIVDAIGGAVQGTYGEYGRYSHGMEVEDGGITVTGGTVTATSGAARVTQAEGSTAHLDTQSYGLLLDCGTKLSVSGGSVTATGGTVSMSGDRIYYGSSYGACIYGDVEVSGSGTLTCIGSAVDVSGKSNDGYPGMGESYGLYLGSYEDNATSRYIGGNVTLSGGKLSATSGNASMTKIDALESEYDYSESTALYADTLTVSGGTLELAHGTASTVGGAAGSAYSYDLSVYELTVSGGTVKLGESYLGSAAVSDGVKLKDLLADEHAYWQITHNSDWDEIDSGFVKRDDLTNALTGEYVTYLIKPCTYTTENGRCPYCGKIFGTVLPIVPYLDATGTENECEEYTLITTSTTALADGWYVVSENVTLTSPLSLTGDAHLILCNGATLTVPGIVDESESHTLAIYGQTAETGKKPGKLAANSCTFENSSFAIVANQLIVNGGEIEATGGSHTANAPVKTSYGIAADCLYVNGGKLTATGGAVSGEGCESCGIFVPSNLLVVNGGELIGNGGAANGKGGNSCGVTAAYLITNGGKLTGISADASGDDSESSGIYTVIALIYGGEVKGTSGKAAANSTGIRAVLALSVNDKTLDLDGIFDDTSITIISSSTTAVVEGTGGTATGNGGTSAGIYTASMSADSANFLLLMLSQIALDADADTDTGSDSTTTPTASARITANGGTAEKGRSYGILSSFPLYVGLTTQDIINAIPDTGMKQLSRDTQTPGAAATSGSTAEITANGNDAGVLTYNIMSLYELALPSVWLNGGKLTATGVKNGVLVSEDNTDSILTTLDLDVFEGEQGGESGATTPVTTVYVQKGTLIADATGTTPGIALNAGEPVSADIPVKCPSAYWWRTDKAGSYTASTTAAYSYTGEHSYVELTDTDPATLPDPDPDPDTGGNVPTPSVPSGGSISAPTYPVNVPGTDNGSITVSPAQAKKGQTVTITVTPDKGSTLEKLTVLDEGGNELELTNNGDGTFSFRMPDGRVEIKASFTEDNTMLNFFVDVPAGAYYYDAVLWAVQKGITEGIDDTHFGPEDSCTRAQIVTFLWRAAGCPEPTSASSFADVPADSYYAKAVSWAIEKGITEGTDDTHFSPDATCTRAQAVAFLFRYAAVSGMDAVTLQELISGFGDAAAVPDYARPAFNWALGSGVVEGYDDQLAPNKPCTRAQIVTMLHRMLVK